jgi:hypothetical protein
MTRPVDALRSGSVSHNRVTTALHSERERFQQARAALCGGYTRLTFLDQLAVPPTLKKITPQCTEPGGSLPLSQQPVTCPYRKAD